ncbi:hypothetical protein AGMMS49992_13060 [Clostridia bacterium]|nr:hypothetical protein AGMMS49992_13060 [Clostridia bacterium]
MKPKWARAFAWLAVGLVLWCMASGAMRARDSQWNPGRVSFRPSSGSFNLSTLKSLREAIADDTSNAGKVTGWAETLSAAVSVSATAASSTVDTLWVNGDASLVWNMPLVSGNYPVADDAEGIAIDSKSALSLFGSTDIIGRTVTVGGVDLVVRGVFGIPEGLNSLGVDPGRGLAVRAAADDTALTSLEFLVQSSGSDTSAVAKAWMQSAGVSTSGTFDSHNDTRVFARLMELLPALLLALFILLEILRALRLLWSAELNDWHALKSNHTMPDRAAWSLMGYWALGLVVLVGGALAVWLMLPPFAGLPASYLPTAWSDFSFWPDLITSKLQSAAQWAMQGVTRPDRAYRLTSWWCMGLIAAAAACLIHSRSLMIRSAAYESKPVLEPTMWGALAVAASMPLGLWAARFARWEASVPPAAVVMAAVWWLAIAALRAGRATDAYAAAVADRIVSRWAVNPLEIIVEPSLSLNNNKEELITNVQRKRRQILDVEPFEAPDPVQSLVNDIGVFINTAARAPRFIPGGGGGDECIPVLGAADIMPGRLLDDNKYVPRAGRRNNSGGQGLNRSVVAADLAGHRRRPGDITPNV